MTRESGRRVHAPSRRPRPLSGAGHFLRAVLRAVQNSWRHLKAGAVAATDAMSMFVRRDSSTMQRGVHVKRSARRAVVHSAKALVTLPVDAMLGAAGGAAVAVGRPFDTARTRGHLVNGARAAVAWAAVAFQMLRSRRRRPVFTAAVGARRVLMLTISQIEIDPRINKEADGLAKAGFDVEVVCFAPAGIDTITKQEVRPGVTWVRVPPRGVASLYFQNALVDAAMHLEFDFVHAHDLTALLDAWCVARRKGVPLIYDAHEMWTENVEFGGTHWVPMTRRTRWLANRVERFALRSTSVFVTVSPSIQQEYVKRHGDVFPRGPILVPNYPSLDLDSVDIGQRTIHDLIGVPATSFVTLYLGGVNPLRNIEAVIEAHSMLPENCVFVIQGPGIDIYRDGYMQLAGRLGIAHRVICREPVGRDEVVAMARTADCGVVMLRNLCRNFYWFFPNKLFEYCLAGVPVAVSEFPDVSAFVQHHGCGVTFDPDQPRSIAAALSTLAGNRAAARAMGERGREAIRGGCNWEQAMKALIGEYEALRS